MPVAGALACTQNEIDVNGDDTQCETAKFTITTTELTADTTFAFYMSARGTFYVDWGDGTVDTITRTDTDETLYDHTYSTAGVKTIRFGGVATGYTTSRYNNTIRFGYSDTADSATPTLISAINGSLGEIFSVQANMVPAFAKSFSRTRITEIPENLFSGIRASTPYMFQSTFAYTSALTSIPANLFADITVPRQGLFNSAFMGSAVKTIPPTLFHSINGSAAAMFQNTFRSASITSIPAELFETINKPANNLFNATFMGCTRLTAIPNNLFKNITGVAANQFYYTFYRCGATGYIPPSLFAGLNNSGLYTTTMMTEIFYNTNLDTTCPAGTVQFVTGYENYWNGHVSCVDENLVCSAGEYLPAHGYECTKCPENNYCVGGTYTYSENTTYGATQCPNSWYAPRGMSSADQCGRILHIGENVVYLRNVKKTTPSLNVRVDGYTFYGNMTTADVPMNANTNVSMKVEYENQTWSIYDDTVTINQE